MTLLGSQDLCKHLYYNDGDPLTKPNLTDTGIVLFQNIYPTPFIPQTTEDAKSIITIVQDEFALGKNNTAFKTSRIVFNVLCHTDLWLMSGTGKIRPYSILNEIDKLFNEKNIMGVGQLAFERCRWIIMNEKWQGYQCSYKNYEFN